MKNILLLIQPKWCEAILSGRKTIEVRKSRSNIEEPFKCYIYCTQGSQLKIFTKENTFYLANGEVIGEFACDEIKLYKPFFYNGALMPTGVAHGSCLTEKDIKLYSDSGTKPLYLWHISDLKIYDKPKELSEFRIPCKTSCRNCQNPKWFDGGCEEKRYRKLTRAPQSWCYVEEIK